MKLLLPLVVILTVFNFKANCRIYTDGPDGDLNPDFTDESQHLLSGSENPHTYDVDHQMKKDVNGENPIKLRGKADKKILKKLIENLKSMEYKLTQIQDNITGKLDSLVDVNSKQDTKLDSIINANMDLQSIKEIQENITGKLDSIIDTNMDLQSIKENQENITGKLDSLVDVNSNQDTKLDSIINANMDLQSIKENQENITEKLDSLKDVNSNQDTKLDSIIDTNMDIQSIKENQENITGQMDSLVEINSNQDTKLDSIIDAIGNIRLTQGIGCNISEGFFTTPGSNQCLKVFLDKRITWPEADTKCKQAGLVLVKPHNAVALHKYLIDTYYDSIGNSWYWVNGKGDGSTMKWQHNDGFGLTTLNNSSPLYKETPSGGSVSTGYCLQLATYRGYLTSHPGKVYVTRSCTGDNEYALCEKIMG